MTKLLTTAAMLIALIAPAGALERELPMSSAARFARIYDKAHLATHPDQIIRAVRLTLTPPSADYPREYGFTLQFELRGRDRPLRAEGSCYRNTEGLFCGVECDGGGVALTFRGDHMLMHIDERGIRVTSSCSASAATDIDNSEMVSGGKDDRVLRLDRVK